MTQHATETAQVLRQRAAAHRQDAADSWERSDTDGFLSQWSSGLQASVAELAAQVAEAGGRMPQTALFDLDGNLVAAKIVPTKFGTAWMLLDGDNGFESQCIGWVNRSRAAKAKTRNANMAKRGYAEGIVLAPVRAQICGGSGTGLSGAASCYAGL